MPAPVMAMRYRFWCFSDAARNKRLHTSAAWWRMAWAAWLLCIAHIKNRHYDLCEENSNETSSLVMQAYFHKRTWNYPLCSNCYILHPKCTQTLYKNDENKETVSLVSPLHPPELGRRHYSHWYRSEQSRSGPPWTNVSWKLRTSDRMCPGPGTQKQNSHATDYTDNTVFRSSDLDYKQQTALVLIM